MALSLVERGRFAAYAAGFVALTVATAGLLTRAPNPMAWGPAAMVALPLSAAAVALLLPVRYLCRALPLDETAWSRLLVTHGGGAAAMGAAWVSLGAGLARLAGSYQPGSGVPAEYEAHVPGVAAGGALLYLLAAAFHYVMLGGEATRRAEQRSLELAVLARESELKALKAQVHPHFLFNSLNSISALVVADPPRAREMCILLSEFFRSSLALGERPSVTLAEELAVARTYLAIEALRLGPRLAVQEAVDEAALACRLPPLLLQPLVENAVRHGIATRAEGGVLHIEARLAGQRLWLRVENPFDPDAPARPGVGLGLSNVRRRLEACYGDDARLDTERVDQRFRVALAIPAEAER